MKKNGWKILGVVLLASTLIARADGQPEPWERAAFFDPKDLEVPLEFAESDDEKRELERIWREAELVRNRHEPSIDARESARKAAQHYHLPGWS